MTPGSGWARASSRRPARTSTTRSCWSGPMAQEAGRVRKQTPAMYEPWFFRGAGGIARDPDQARRDRRGGLQRQPSLLPARRLQEEGADLVLMPHCWPLPTKAGGAVSEADIQRWHRIQMEIGAALREAAGGARGLRQQGRSVCVACAARMAARSDRHGVAGPRDDRRLGWLGQGSAGRLRRRADRDGDARSSAQGARRRRKHTVRTSIQLGQLACLSYHRAVWAVRPCLFVESRAQAAGSPGCGARPTPWWLHSPARPGDSMLDSRPCRAATADGVIKIP